MIVPYFQSEKESPGIKKIPGNNTWKLLMSHSAENNKNKHIPKQCKNNRNNIEFFFILSYKVVIAKDLRKC